MPLSTGVKIGPYEILAPLGAGGMGEVYKARDTRLNRTVAIKVLPPKVSGDEGRRKRLLQEARAASALNHPNIVTVYDIVSEAARDSIVMEYIEGRTLAEMIRGTGLPLKEAVGYGIAIADALAAAHAAGIVHRDLKPSNIMVTKGGIKLLDFGLARFVSSAAVVSLSSETITIENTIAGTLAYMAPEQLAGRECDARSDIFAFGLIFQEMAKGTPVFAASTHQALMEQVLRCEPELLSNLPTPVAHVAERCLAKNPDRRWQSARDIAAELEWAGRTTGETEGAKPRSPLEKPRWLIAVVAVLCAALALVSIAWWRASRQPPMRLMRMAALLGGELARGDTISMVLSPDGTRIVYRGRNRGKVQLFSRPLDRDESVALTGTENGEDPFFSPDGESVAFFADQKLKTISLHEGPPVVVCDAPNARGGAWGPDGNIIAALNFSSPLSRVPASGGVPQPLTELVAANHESTHRWPQVTPQGEEVIFTANATVGDWNQATIEIQSLKTGERKTVVRGGHYGRYAASGHLLFIRDRKLYAAPLDLAHLRLTGAAVPVMDDIRTPRLNGAADLDLSTNGVLVYRKGPQAEQSLVWLNRDGEIEPMGAQPALFGSGLRVSPDGKRFVLPREKKGKYKLWTYDWERDVMTRLTFTPESDFQPAWSPDSHHIAFVSMKNGIPKLHWTRADGVGEAVSLSNSNQTQQNPSFSPDGKWLVYDESDPATKRDVWALPLGNPQADDPKPGKPVALLQTPFNEGRAAISPDGRWIAYQSDDAGHFEIYVRTFPAMQGKWLVSHDGGTEPVWSRKGHNLFYRTSEGIVAASYIAGREFVTSATRLWMPQKDIPEWWDISVDDRRVAFFGATAGPATPEHVIFLLNFFDELRRRAPQANAR